jgi:hypothetical protein
VGERVNSKVGSFWDPSVSLFEGWPGESCNWTQAKFSEFYMISAAKQLDCV